MSIIITSSGKIVRKRHFLDFYINASYMVVTESLYFVQHKHITEIVWLYSLNPGISISVYQVYRYITVSMSVMCAKNPAYNPTYVCDVCSV